uniref:C2H2-type domain-containing protein n=1 Tax=Plectus sambesii TaxID=2011161 RepID=A0A914URU7_9BILA
MNRVKFASVLVEESDGDMLTMDSEDGELVMVGANEETTTDGQPLQHQEVWRCVVKGCGMLFYAKGDLSRHCADEHAFIADQQQIVQNVDIHLRRSLVTQQPGGRDSASYVVRDKEASLDGREVYQCGVRGCDKAFLSRAGRARHRRELHPGIAFDNPKAGRFACGMCSVMWPSYLALCEHLRTSHGEPAFIKRLKFKSVADFRGWSRELEERTGERFVQRKSNKQMRDFYLSCLMCRRSGFLRQRPSKALGLRSRTKRGCTIKMEFHCSAFIDVYIYKSGEVHIKCCLHHYGHDTRLPQAPPIGRVVYAETDYDQQHPFYEEEAYDEGPEGAVEHYYEQQQEATVSSCEEEIVVDAVEDEEGGAMVEYVLPITQRGRRRKQTTKQNDVSQPVAPPLINAVQSTRWIAASSAVVDFQEPPEVDDGGAHAGVEEIASSNHLLQPTRRSTRPRTSTLKLQSDATRESLSTLPHDDNPTVWFHEISASLQAVRASALSCQADAESRQQISEAVDHLWEFCDQVRLNARKRRSGTAAVIGSSSSSNHVNMC